MKGKIRQLPKKYAFGEWRPCAPSLIPHRAFIDKDLWRWVWYEPLEYRESVYVDVYWTKYRIPGAPVD